MADITAMDTNPGSFSDNEDPDGSTSNQDANFFHVKATPLFEFSLISISGELPARMCRSLISPDGSRNIFYAIQLSDVDDLEVFSFQSHLGKVSFVDDDCFLQLGNSECITPQWLTKFFKMKLEVRNTSGNILIDDVFLLDFSGEIVYDKEQCFHFDRKEFGVDVHYRIFKHAVIANVNCTLSKKENGDNVGREYKTPSIRGTILARFNVVGNCLSRMISEYEPGPDPTPLASLSLTSCFAVSAYSPLSIFFELVVDGETIKSDEKGLEFIPCIHCSVPDVMEIFGDKWYVVVSVNWSHGYDSLPHLSECFLPGRSGVERVDFSEIEDSSIEGLEDEDIYEDKGKRPRIGNVSPDMSTYMSTQMMVEFPLSCAGGPRLMEIFSISVCPFVESSDKLDNVFLLNGMIECYDAFDDYVLFNTRKDSSVSLRSHDILCIEEPNHCYMGPKLGFRLNLKDGEGREIVCGGVAWDFHTATLWYDRRICSVIAGKYGFSTIHYTIFSNSVQARVVVSFECTGDDAYQVYGEISTRYTGYRYSTGYDKKYYTSRLFEKGQLGSIEICNDGRLPLSKSVIAVPSDESLLVIIDLCIIQGANKERLRGITTFDAEEAWTPKRMSGPQSVLHGSDYGLSVLVIWR